MVVVFRKDKWFKLGWAYFVVMFILEIILPAWTGEENGVIENLQMLWLFAGLWYSWKMIRTKQRFLEQAKYLWTAGCVYFFLLIMREISWGRVFFVDEKGHMAQYSDLGLYGKLVHPTVAVLIVVALYCLYKAKIWRTVLAVKLPIKSFVLLLLFIFMSWVGEKSNFTGFHGEVAEELAEFGAYMMMYVVTKDMGKRLEE